MYETLSFHSLSLILIEWGNLHDTNIWLQNMEHSCFILTIRHKCKSEILFVWFVFQTLISNSLYRRSVSHLNSHFSFPFLPLQWQKITSFQIFCTVCATLNAEKLWETHAHWHCWFFAFPAGGQCCCHP